MTIKWEKEYELGLSVIDSQHKQFIETLSQLYDAVSKMQAKETIQKIFDGLADYLLFHFKNEEEYFKEFNYQGAEEHKKAHQEFRQKINDFQARSLAGDNDLISLELLDYLEDWLVKHLDDMDKKYVQCFKEHGLS